MVGEGWKGAVWPVRDGAEDLRDGAVWSEEGEGGARVWIGCGWMGGAQG